MKVSDQDKERVREFIEEGDKFFVGWLNGTISKDQINNISELIDDNLKILYSEEPEQLLNKQELLNLLPPIYGSSKQNPIQRSNEYRHWLKLDEDKVLVQYQEHTLVEEKVQRTRSISAIIKISEPIKLLYSHE